MALHKLLCAFIFFLLFVKVSFAQTPAWNWAKSAGGHYSDQLTPATIETDSSGNSYSMGNFQSPSVTFGAFTLTNPQAPTYSRSFFVKYNAQGIVQWAKLLPYQTYITKFITDKAGNSTILADFIGSITILGYTFVDTSYSMFHPGNCFIKINSNGVVTSVSTKHTKRSQFVDMYAFDDSHILLVGNTVTENNPYVPALSDSVDGFVCPSGTFLALLDTNNIFTQYKYVGADTLYSNPAPFTHYGSAYYGERSITVSKQKSVFIHLHHSQYWLVDSTTFQLPPYIGTGPNDLNTTGYIAKLDSNLDFKWATPFIQTRFYAPGFFADDVGLMATDNNDNVYSIGSFLDTLFVNHQPYTVFHYYSDNGYVYVNKLAGADGQNEWVKFTPVIQFFNIWDICTDQLGNVYPMGSTLSDIMFDGITVPSHTSAANLFIYKFKPDGTVVWGKGNDLNGSAWQPLMKEDDRGNIIIAGDLTPGGSVGFDHDTLTCLSVAPGYPGSRDVFTAKLGNCNKTAPVVTPASAIHWCGVDSVLLTASASEHYLWSNGDTTQSILVHVSGAYDVIASDNSGCYARSQTINVMVHDIPSIQMSAVTNTSTSGNGMAIAVAAGGIAPYHYLWNTLPPQLTDTAFHLQHGWYEVTVTDAVGCEQKDSVFVNENIVIDDPGGQFLLTPNPANGFVIVKFGSVIVKALLTVYSSDGKRVIRRTINSSLPEYRLDTGLLSSGVYIVELNIANNHYRQKLLVINNKTP